MDCGIDERSTYKWGDTDTVGGASVQILVVIDTSQVDDGIYKITLLWTAVHEIRVGDPQSHGRKRCIGHLLLLVGNLVGRRFWTLMAVISDKLLKVGDLLFSYSICSIRWQR